MKKIAIFVEGQTEQFFINKLLIEIAGQKNIFIKLKKFKGIGKPTEDIYPKTLAQPLNPQHTALIYDCAGDEGVKSRIIEEYDDLITDGYAEIIGLRDLFPLSDINKLENSLNDGLVRRGVRLLPALPENACIIVAVNEVESWFLAECNHFQCIDTRLTEVFLISNIGYNPCLEDVTFFTQPSQNLKTIYQFVGKTYNKKRKTVERTVECLDYTNIYLTIRNRIVKLNELITKIDEFLT